MFYGQTALRAIGARQFMKDAKDANDKPGEFDGFYQSEVAKSQLLNGRIPATDRLTFSLRIL